MTKQRLLKRARAAKRESKFVDFKVRFDPRDKGAWCELVKDIVAMANGGGGVIVFGVYDNGTPARFDATPVLELDPAKITDQVAKYTGRQFADFEVTEVVRKRSKKAVLLVFSSLPPMVFSKAGTYLSNQTGRERIAFQVGTVYFRHGAKSQPATEADLHSAIQREVARQRKDWLSGVRKLTMAPPGSTVRVEQPTSAAGTAGKGPPARLVADPGADPVRIVDGDEMWPLRSKDVIGKVRERLGEGTFNSHDMLCVRTIHRIEEQHPKFVYRPFLKAAPQYSLEYVEWLVERFRRNPLFFQEARRAYKDL